MLAKGAAAGNSELLKNAMQMGGVTPMNDRMACGTAQIPSPVISPVATGTICKHMHKLFYTQNLLDLDDKVRHGIMWQTVATRYAAVVNEIFSVHWNCTPRFSLLIENFIMTSLHAKLYSGRYFCPYTS